MFPQYNHRYWRRLLTTGKLKGHRMPGSGHGRWLVPIQCARRLLLTRAEALESSAHSLRSPSPQAIEQLAGNLLARPAGPTSVHLAKAVIRIARRVKS